jgi:hypothetical protein
MVHEPEGEFKTVISAFWLGLRLHSDIIPLQKRAALPIRILSQTGRVLMAEIHRRNNTNVSEIHHTPETFEIA